MKNSTKFSILLITFMIILAGIGFSAEDPILEEIRTVNKIVSQNIFMENIDEVHNLLNGMLEKYPENQLVKLAAGDRFSDIGEHERAVELISDIDLASFPESFYTLLSMGEIYHSAGRYKTALPYLKQAIDDDQVFPYAYGLLADSYAKLYMNEAAVNVYQMGIYLNSFYTPLKIEYLQFLNNIKAYDEMLSLISEYNLDPLHAKEKTALLFQEILALEGKEEYEKALTKIEQYEEVTSEPNEELTLVKAECLLKLDRTEDAYAFLAKAISTVENETTRFELLKLNAELNISELAFLEAKKNLTLALTIKSDDIEIHENLAECYLQLGKTALYKAELNVLEELKR